MLGALVVSPTSAPNTSTTRGKEVFMAARLVSTWKDTWAAILCGNTVEEQC